MRAIIEAQLAAKLEAKLVRELLEAHSEAKRNYYLGGLRLSAVEGGRFCEAAFRLLEYATKNKKFIPLSKSLTSTDKLILELSNLTGRSSTTRCALHIPRSLRLVYDIRNKRDAAHLSDGIDPNLQDATLVIGVLDWVLAEFIRLYHDVPADEASRNRGWPSDASSARRAGLRWLPESPQSQASGQRSLRRVAVSTRRGGSDVRGAAQVGSPQDASELEENPRQLGGGPRTTSTSMAAAT